VPRPFTPGVRLLSSPMKYKGIGNQSNETFYEHDPYAHADIPG
jgi:hypothetical protein